jgi:hypothetical protein
MLIYAERFHDSVQVLLGVSKFGFEVDRIILATSSPVTFGMTRSVMIMSKPVRDGGNQRGALNLDSGL